MAACKLEEEKLCDGCGECDRCDLNPDKICDNCCLCIALEDLDYASIPVVMQREDN